VLGPCLRPCLCLVVGWVLGLLGLLGLLVCGGVLGFVWGFIGRSVGVVALPRGGVCDEHASPSAAASSPPAARRGRPSGAHVSPDGRARSCAGTVIGPRVVVTAARCPDGRDAVGGWTHARGAACPGTAQRRPEDNPGS
jgi:hypothetical protein